MLLMVACGRIGFDAPAGAMDAGIDGAVDAAVDAQVDAPPDAPPAPCLNE